MRLAALLMGLALACTSPEAPPATVAAPPTKSPAEAVDLDPAPGIVHVALRAEALGAGLAYNGQTPGPTIRAFVGDTLVVDLQNALDADTTIHWHGVHVPNAMDGVTWKHDAVAPGGSFTYTFTADRAGTFWYHAHADEGPQVDLGLYGVLVVEDPSEPRADEEVVLVFDVPGEEQPAAGEHHHGGENHLDHGLVTALPAWHVNGAQRPTLRFKGGRSVRARLLNASNASYLDLRWLGIRLIATDQGLLSAAQSPSGLVLAPGDRAEVEWSIGEAGFAIQAAPYTLNGGAAYGLPIEIATVAVDDPKPAPAAIAWPFKAAAPTADPVRTDIVWTLTGSAEGGGWLINGETFPDVTIASAPLGTDVVIEVRNLSPTLHPFHLHGMPFEVLSMNGSPPPFRDVEDTLDLPLRASGRLLVHADNPGEWLAHCHILPHAHGGMATVLRVEATP